MLGTRHERRRTVSCDGGVSAAQFAAEADVDRTPRRAAARCAAHRTGGRGSSVAGCAEPRSSARGRPAKRAYARARSGRASKSAGRQGEASKAADSQNALRSMRRCRGARPVAYLSRKRINPMNTVIEHPPDAGLRRHQAAPAGHLGQRRLSPSSAPPCRSSARPWPRRPTSVPASACSTSPPATATPRWPPRAALPIVTSTDYVPALLDKGRARAQAEGLPVQFQLADAEALPFADASFDVVLSTFGVDVHARPSARAARDAARAAPGRPHRPGELDARRLHRPPVQGHRRPRAAAGRRCSRRRCGAPSRTSSSCSAPRRVADPLRAPHFNFRYRSAAHWVQVFRDFYGPTHKAFARARGSAPAGRSNATSPPCCRSSTPAASARWLCLASTSRSSSRKA